MLLPLFGKTLTDINQIVNDLSLPAYTARQISDWLYKKNVSSIDEMTNLSAKARVLLSERHYIGVSDPVDV